MFQEKSGIIFLILTVLLVISMAVGIMVGPVSIHVKQILIVVIDQLPGLNLAGVHENARTIITELRIPRVLLGFLVGGALAVSGTIMQGIFRNPLATPYILGVASGGSAGASLVILLGVATPLAHPLGALGGAAMVVGMVYRLSWSRGTTSTYTLILAGVALSALCSAITTFLIFLAGPYEQHRILFWIMGGLWKASWPVIMVMFPLIGFGMAGSLFWGRDMNALALGENTAFHLGIKPEQVKTLLLGLATVITALSVAVAGTIGFVGLIVPHILRLLMGPDHRKLLLASVIGGGGFLIAMDAVARFIMPPSEVPVGVITAFLGAPFFLYLLRRTRTGMQIG